ncbi:DUF3331 domain-containing protein [Paraburkholderia caledonica]|uniref:DUF3331 domain-containing protein n=1 Tax=Paraburkholderia caledonica TaxID=134536 RepID=UPI000380049E|nr:DUF3331 domain-containing protein [Paraburkholderia caledonica]
MLDKANYTDPWLRTLGLLSALSGDTDLDDHEFVAALTHNAQWDRRASVRRHHREVQVRVIDRPSPSTATLAWRDSTHCSYGDQVWHMSHARVAGVCAMSGRPIKRGDAIYKPRPCRPAPLNAGAMILCTVLNTALEA